MTTTNPDETDKSPSRRPKRRRAEPKLYISFLPEGRGGPREDKGSVPLEVDVESHIEERTDCEPGLYRIEKKRSGEFSGEVLFYSKDDATAEPPAPGIGDFDEPDVGDSEADIRKIVATTVNAVLDARDRRERATAGQPPDPMEQFRKMRELLKEERDSGSSTQQDPIAMFERLVALQKKLTPEPPEPADTLSAKDRAQLMLVKESGLIPEFMRSMRDMLRAPDDATEPKGLLEKALEYVGGWTPYVGPVLAPVLGQKVSEVLSHVNVDAIAQRMNSQASQIPAATASPQPGPQPNQSDFARSIEAQLLEALSVVVECMTLDTDDSDGVAHVDRAANAISQFAENNPVVAQQILGAMFAESSTTLVMQLAAQKPEWAYLVKLANATDFIDRLKRALNADEEPDNVNPLETDDANAAASEVVAAEVERIAPSANGAKSAVSVEA